LSLKHGIVAAKESTARTLKYGKKSLAGGSAKTAHELNRDILIWFCRDLIAFEAVEKDGFVAFFQKNFLTCQTPTASTLSITALNDVYQSYLQKVLLYVQNISGVE